jgi:hypothetical protein
VVLEQVEASGGVDAPTVPAPDSGDNGIFGQIPGLGNIPGLDDLLEGLPDVGGLLDDLLQGSGLPEELRNLLDDLLGIEPSSPAPDQDGGE